MSTQESGTVEEVRDLIDFEEVTRSINGFDEIAITGMFGQRFARMEDTTAARAVLFVVLRRTEKLNDKDAYREAMNLGLAELEARFRMDTGSEVLSESDQAERDREYGEFVASVGMFLTPDQYRALTLGERAALIEANRRR